MEQDFDIDGMRVRIEEQLDKAGITARAACLNANMSPGYLHSILKENRAPTVPKLAELCAKNGLSLPYILFGFEISPETQELVSLIEQDPGLRDNVLSLLKR